MLSLPFAANIRPHSVDRASKLYYAARSVAFGDEVGVVAFALEVEELEDGLLGVAERADADADRQFAAAVGAVDGDRELSIAESAHESAGLFRRSRGHDPEPVRSRRVRAGRRLHGRRRRGLIGWP